MRNQKPQISLKQELHTWPLTLRLMWADWSVGFLSSSGTPPPPPPPPVADMFKLFSFFASNGFAEQSKQFKHTETEKQRGQAF